MKTAVVIGATGLVGEILTNKLAQSNFYDRVIVLVRRPVTFSSPKIESVILNFDKPDSSLIKGNDIFCAIGTTIKKAGSKANQFKIDCEYPAEIARIARENGAEQFILVSSIGADANSSNFYLKTKGQLEERLTALNFPSLIILRPSFILGNRKENRMGEKIGIVLAKLLGPLMIGGLRKYKGVEATVIANRMVVAAVSENKGKLIIESDRIS